MKEKYVKALQDVVKIPSVNDKEHEVALYIQELLKEHGIESELIEYSPGRSNLVAEIKNGEGKVLGISGHMDVVAPGNLEEWIHPPFDAVIDGDTLYGRGAADMKAGLMALTFAMIHLNETKEFKGTIRLLATVAEETGEFGANQLTELGYAKDLDACLIAEPLTYKLIYAQKGSLNYTVVSKGVAAHTSMPHLGVNALTNLRKAMDLVDEKMAENVEAHENEILGRLIHTISICEAGEQVNSVPDIASYRSNARTIPEYDNDNLLKDVQDILDELNKKEGFDLELVVDADMPPVFADKNSELIQTVLEVIKDKPHFNNDYFNELMVKNLPNGEAFLDQIETVFPGELEAYHTSGSTDAAQFVRGNEDLEVCVWGPGYFPTVHQVNEAVSVEQYLDFIEVYGEIISAYLK